MDYVTNLKAIVSGFKNYKFPSKTMEELAKERAKICATCEYANPNHPFKKMIDDQRTEIINGMGCNICGCLLSAKVRQLFTDCPEKKWGNRPETENLTIKEK